MYIRLVSRQDFYDELVKGLLWLEETKSALQCEIPHKLSFQSIEEEIKKLQVCHHLDHADECLYASYCCRSLKKRFAPRFELSLLWEQKKLISM